MRAGHRYHGALPAPLHVRALESSLARADTGSDLAANWTLEVSQAADLFPAEETFYVGEMPGDRLAHLG
jgi:hypothetical protein